MSVKLYFIHFRCIDSNSPNLCPVKGSIKNQAYDNSGHLVYQAQFETDDHNHDDHSSKVHNYIVEIYMNF